MFFIVRFVNPATKMGNLVGIGRGRSGSFCQGVPMMNFALRWLATKEWGCSYWFAGVNKERSQNTEVKKGLLSNIIICCQALQWRVRCEPEKRVMEKWCFMFSQVDISKTVGVTPENLCWAFPIIQLSPSAKWSVLLMAFSCSAQPALVLKRWLPVWRWSICTNYYPVKCRRFIVNGSIDILITQGNDLAHPGLMPKQNEGNI